MAFFDRCYENIDYFGLMASVSSALEEISEQSKLHRDEREKI